MSAAEADGEQCRALTSDGERCTRPAQDGGFCYQHGPEDETIDNEESETMSDDKDVSETEIGSVREKIRQVAADLIGRPLVSVIAVNRDRDRGGDDEDEEPGWVAAVEILERESVPDTQDILGRYEISLDADHEITGYRRTHRYRRDDMDQDI